MMAHLCHAIGCEKRVPPRMLFCAPHWRMLDPKTQALVWSEYTPGQEVRKDPSVRYVLVQAVAVARVAMEEGRLSTDLGLMHVLSRIWSFLPVMSDDDIAYVRTIYPAITEEQLEKMRITRDNRKALGARGETP